MKMFYPCVMVYDDEEGVYDVFCVTSIHFEEGGEND